MSPGAPCLVREHRAEDLDAVARLCDARRRAYALHQPVFWRPAAGAAEAGHAFLADQLARPGTLAAVHETAGVVDGFLLASIVDAPPVYDPGGRTCAIDDFAVRDPASWAHVGPELLAAVASRARERGAVQCVVVTSARDQPKIDVPAGARRQRRQRVVRPRRRGAGRSARRAGALAAGGRGRPG